MKIYSWSACILFLNEDVPVKKAKLTAEGDFSQPSSKHKAWWKKSKWDQASLEIFSPWRSWDYEEQVDIQR